MPVAGLIGIEVSHNGVGIVIFIILFFSVKCWFTWEGGGVETLGNGYNSVAFSDKVI